MSKSPRSGENTNIDNSSTPSPFVLNADIVSLIDFSLFSDMDIRNLAMTNKLLRKLADNEFNRRLGSYCNTVFIQCKNITTAYNNNPIVAKTLLENASYVTLIEIMDIGGYNNNDNILYSHHKITSARLASLQEISQQEIQQRDQRIEYYLTKNQLTDPYYAIEHSLKENHVPIAINLIGKYLYTTNLRYSTPEVEASWKPIQDFLNKRHDNNDTLLHLIARKNDPELVYSVARSVKKAFLDAEVKQQKFMTVNDEGNSPYHTAFDNNNYLSLLSLEYCMKSIFCGVHIDSILNQKNRSGQTTSECIELATQELSGLSVSANDNEKKSQGSIR